MTDDALSCNWAPRSQRIVLVLGMHRSGTSALARALPIFGIHLGERLMPPVQGDNDKGFWEDLDVYEMNMRVLEAVGADWHSTEPILEADFFREAVQDLRSDALDLLTRKLGRRPAFGMKDPRLSRLLPFWKPVFRQLGLQPIYLLATRNPVSVARSLGHRNGFQHDKSYLLWIQHTIAGLCGTRGESRLCIDYDELMLDPPRQLRRLGRLLGQAPPEMAAREYCSEFLEQRLRRTRHFIGDLEADAGPGSAVCRLYELLRRVAVDDRPQAWEPIERFVTADWNS